jgi:hypothetical protein
MDDELKQRVLALPEHDRQLFLVSLIHLLTVAARGEYPHIRRGEAPPETYEDWQWINELIHRVTSQLRNHIDGGNLRISDAEALDILLEHDDSRAGNQLRWALLAALGDNPAWPTR